MTTCCIVVPVHTLEWSAAEARAITVCAAKLRGHDFVFLHKQSIASSDLRKRHLSALPFDPQARFLAVPDRYLASVQAYNQMMLSSWFYRLFEAWDYILVFQLDSWILGGDLDGWLQKSYSYVGAPWLPEPGSTSQCPATGVGNGGLSLRRVKDMVRIFSSPRYRWQPIESLFELASSNSLFRGYSHRRLLWRPLLFLARALRVLRASLGWQNTLAYRTRINEQEDIIISQLAPRVYPWLQIPSVPEAAAFAFETSPRVARDAFAVEIPFGCHAWQKYDKPFFLAQFPSEFEGL